MSSRTGKSRARRTSPGASRLGLLVLGISIAMLAVLISAGSTAVAKTATQPVAYHSETGMIAFLGSAPGRPLATAAELGGDSSPVATARAFLDRRGEGFGVSDQARELRLMSVRESAAGSIVRFRQLFEGVPVLGGELVVSLDRDGNVLSASGETLPGANVSVEATVSAAAAREVALESARKAGAPAVLGTTAPGLWIYDSRLLGGPGLDRPVLVWRTDVTGDAFDRLVLVDAQLGSVALSFDQLETARNREVCDANNTTTKVPCTAPFERVEGGPPSGIADVNDAYDLTGATYDFFWSTLGRDSIDGAGMTLTSTTRYCPSGPCPYPNAYWNGAQMVFGQGYASADDVVGHELTHGVTDYTSRLFYYYQSGAINESLSDVFGELTDLTYGGDPPGDRWLLGEDLAIGAIRNMANPPAFGDPDRMTSPNYTADPSEGDGGGVHTNSGVNNKAAFLITDGGTFNGETVTGLGLAKAAHVYYEVESLLTSASDYADLYNLLQQACANLVGTAGITSDDCLEVKDAVEATEMNVLPPAAPNPEAPMCSSGSPQNLFYDDLENTASGNWSLQTGSGLNRWFYPQVPNPIGLDATYATSGTRNFWGYDQPATADFSIAMTSSVTLPAGAYLRFNHAFGFEDNNVTGYDGGVLEYSTNGGASWSDAGALLMDNGYNGTISSGYGNPLGGRSAFVKESNGYVSSRVSLASLAGQSVRFRFRIGTDSTSDDYGWFVDDVRIYTCGGAGEAPWPMFQHDRRHTGRTSLAGPAAADVAWTFPLDGKAGTPVVGADGTIYLPAGALNEFDPGKGYLYAVNPNGTQQWRHDLPGPPGSTAPAIGNDGTVYVHLNGGEGNIAAIERVRAVNPNGTTKWTHEFGTSLTSSVMSSPAVADDGTVWVGSPNTNLYALDPDDGSIVCSRSPSASSIASSPAIAPDGTVYVVDSSTTLFAVEPDCDVKWGFQLSDIPIGGANDESPSVAADGTVWVGSPDHYVYAVNPTGTQKCRFQTGDSVRSAPAIAGDGTVYAASDGLYALDPGSCSQKWRFAPFGSQFSSGSPVVDGSGNVYTPLLGIWDVYSLTPGGAERWSLPVDPIGSAGADPTAAIAQNGVLYQADGGFSGPKRLRAIVALPRTLSVSRTGSGSGSVASSPAGIACGATCAHGFPFGTVVKLTATPASGSTFAGWSGGCSGTGTCTLTMSAHRSATARFEKTPPPPPPPPAYRTLRVSKAGAGSGSVVSAPAGISCGPACAYAFGLGTPVTLTAAPASTSTFAGWSGACSGTGPCTVAMSADRTVVATFQLKASPPPVRCVVPRVKGKLLAAAKRAITRAHCSTGRVTRAYSARVRKGRVISQRPPAGRNLRRGAKVNLVVSKGRRS